MKFSLKTLEIDMLKTIRIGIGAALAILAAGSIGLLYNTSAGIITLLTIQDTKKETLTIAMKRMFAFFAALLSAAAAFGALGYTPLSFGCFLLIFILLCTILKLQDGIAMNAVLTTHFFMQQEISRELIINEFLLLVIGAGIGVILNLFKRGRQKEIIEKQRKIEEEIRTLLIKLSKDLLQQGRKYDDSYFYQLNLQVEDSIKKAYANTNNTLLTDTKYYIHYLEMRKSQIRVLKRIYKNIIRLTMVPKQAYPVSEFIAFISESFHESNDAGELLGELEDLYLYFTGEELPSTREEFENRAILFQILKEVENFLLIKKDYMDNLSENEIKIYSGV